jgi:hypothetical protein
MSENPNRPEHDAPDEEARREQQEGQVSETDQPEPAVGGADATDKSTGTAPDQADQPRS